MRLGDDGFICFRAWDGSGLRFYGAIREGEVWSKHCEGFLVGEDLYIGFWR
jgi:hypothetical protein